MTGGGSCEVFALERGGARWVLRRAPAHPSSSTAHDVIREFRLLDAIKDTGARIPWPIVACDDSEVFGAPFYVMERIDGEPVRSPDGSTPTDRRSTRRQSSTATTRWTTRCTRPRAHRDFSPSSIGRWRRSATRLSTWRGQ